MNENKKLKKQLAEAIEKIEKLEGKNNHRVQESHHESDDENENDDESTTSTTEVEVPPPRIPTNKGQKWCEACQANVSSKNFSAHTKTKKHQQNLNK